MLYHLYTANITIQATNYLVLTIHMLYHLYTANITIQPTNYLVLTIHMLYHLHSKYLHSHCSFFVDRLMFLVFKSNFAVQSSEVELMVKTAIKEYFYRQNSLHDAIVAVCQALSIDNSMLL